MRTKPILVGILLELGRALGAGAGEGLTAPAAAETERVIAIKARQIIDGTGRDPSPTESCWCVEVGSRRWDPLPR